MMRTMEYFKMRSNGRPETGETINYWSAKMVTFEHIKLKQTSPS